LENGGVVSIYFKLSFYNKIKLNNEFLGIKLFDKRTL